jgi:hypothetical protein
VVEGELYAAAEGSQPQKHRSGELVLFTQNDGHLLGSDLRLPPVSARDVIVPSERGELHSIRHGGGAPMRMICGYLGCERVQGNPVVATLPAAMKLKVGETGPAEWIRSTFHYAATKVARGRPGSATVLAKLSELLFVEAMRRYVEELPADQTAG